jgi:hypothetical protein
MQDATRAQQCLARLCELTAPQWLWELWPIVLRIARLVYRFRSQPLSPAAMQHFETELARLLTELGRRIVEWTLNHLEPHERDRLPRELFWHNDHYRLKRRSPSRNWNCLFGNIRVWRWLYEPTEGLGLSALFPLELKLGLVAGVATPALADRVAQLAVDFSQRQVLAVLREQHHVCWGVTTLRKVTAAVAEAMSPFRHLAQVEQVLTWLQQAAATGGPRRIVLSVGRDGVMLPIRGLQKYKEGAAATVSVFNRWGKRLGTVYLGQMPEAGQGTLSAELTRLLGDVLSAWEGSPLRLVYVTDAGFHPSEYFQQVLSRLPDPRQPGKCYEWEWVVDYYHACQYLSQLGEALFGPGRAAHAWAAKMRRWLKEKPGGVFRVLRSAGALRTLRGLVGEAADYDGAYAYLRGHAAAMDYSNYRRLRTPIGSGVTEAACKILFTQRFKRAGMKWNLHDGQPILELRVIALSNLWTTVRNAMLNSHNQPQPRTPHALPQEPTQIAA